MKTTPDPDQIETAANAFNYGRQERATLMDLAQDMYDSEQTMEELEEVLKEGGYPPIRAKEYAAHHWEMVFDHGEEDDEEDED
jgi:hypothetical protein